MSSIDRLSMPAGYCSCGSCVTCMAQGGPLDRRSSALLTEVHAYGVLKEAIRAHRTARYGNPPEGHYFTIDKDLYEAAGI